MLAKQDFKTKFFAKNLIFKTEDNVPVVELQEKKYGENNFVFASLKSKKKEVGSGVGPGSGFISQRYGFADTDPHPHQKVTDLQQWKGRNGSLLKKLCAVLPSFFDPDWIRIKSGQWIRFRIRGGKNDPQR